jgi:hypothetical protein
MPKPNYKSMISSYIYDCNGVTKQLQDDQETIVEHNKYDCVVCTDCCNVPVLHLLRRGEV